MPPRYAYWTILIDDQPTAFRAREREELLPTYNQLARKNDVIAMRWFARGKLWDSPEAERAAQERPRAPFEKRNRDWRPGGEHKDPRARFTKQKVHRQHTSEKPRSEPSAKPAGATTFRPAPRAKYVAQIFKPDAERKPFRKTFRPPAAATKPAGRQPAATRPWSSKPRGPRKPKLPEDE